MRTLTVYQAGPITGCSYQGCTDWRKRMVEQLPEFTFLSPMRAKLYLSDCEEISKSYEGENDLKTILSGKKGINARDHWDCYTCDIIFANLEGATIVSIGTVMEIAWGFAYRKPTIVVMQDDNMHQHPMVLESATHICPTMEIGMKVLQSLR